MEQYVTLELLLYIGMFILALLTYINSINQNKKR